MVKNLFFKELPSICHITHIAYCSIHFFLISQKIFSKILATFERDVMTWLPPVEELEHFMKQLSEHDISSSEENGEVSVCGSLEAILSIKV